MRSLTRRAIRVAGITLWAAGLGVLANGQSIGSEPRVAIIPRMAPLPAEESPHSTFRMDVKLIQIPVTVTDMRDQPVMGIPKDHFKLFEDDVEQQIVTFSMADAPVSTGLVFDSSGSMRDRIEDSRAAVHQFFETAGPGDEFSLVRFSDKAELISGFTHDIGRISESLASIHARGWTAMIDGICLSLGEMHHASHPRRVLLVLSDGGDNNSRYSQSELLSILREASVRVFAIGLFDRPRYLEKLADETGGHVIWIRKLSDLPDAMDKLSLQIRNEYMVGYFSDHALNDGKYHKVRVEVQPPTTMKQVRTSWRRGYIAP